MAARRVGAYHTSGNANTLSSITLMLLGKTGQGKSSLANMILSCFDCQEAFFCVTPGFVATPISEAVAKELQVHDRLVKIVDTPGVMDNNSGVGGGGDELAVKGICHGISLCPEGVDVFLIVMRLDARLTVEEMESVAKLERLFGPTLWRHVILVFTRGDCVDNDKKQFEDRIADARKALPQFHDLMSKLITGAILVDAGTKRDAGVAKKQVNKLLLTADMLVSENEKKYTNDIFATVKSELANGKTASVIGELEDLRSQMQHLMEKVSQLESLREEDKQKMEVLKIRTRDAESKLEKALKMAADIAAKSVFDSRKCCIL